MNRLSRLFRSSYPQLLAVLLGLAVLGGPAPSEAGTILLSGDITPTFSLTNTIPNAAAAGNQQFFTNILGSGTDVVVLDNSNNAFASSETDEFYDGLSGVTSTLVSGELTAGNLAGVDLLLIPAPDGTFSASEVMAISGLVNAGGSLFLMGDSSVIPFGPAVNAIINDLLADLGAGFSLDNTALDGGPQVASGAQIVPSPFTAGVSELNYGAASSLTGGNPLFLATTGEPFVAFVPEPSTGLLFGGGLLGLAARGRRRKA
jgi:hypothetical protein